MTQRRIRIFKGVAMILLIGLFACSSKSQQAPNTPSNPTQKGSAMTTDTQLDKATLAGGCFWCMVAPFEAQEGVVLVVTGYAGGHVVNPTYEQVSERKTGHVEAVQISYDPKKVSYNQLLDIFWTLFDPTDAGGSFGDRGPQYESRIFYHTPEQQRIAELSKKSLQESGPFQKPVVTPIVPYTNFYSAEEHHQNYHVKNERRYNDYRQASGRASFIEQTWANFVKPSAPEERFPVLTDAELKEKLSALQYQVTRQDATEPPFKNTYWDNEAEGIYVDLVTGEPLFSSKDKFDSGTGWPSFTRPISESLIARDEDYKLGYPRTEARSKRGDTHLGHVFNDGPGAEGERWCINSAALKFVAKEDLAKEGYGDYLQLFEEGAAPQKQ